jgi:hypothetical protein
VSVSFLDDALNPNPDSIHAPIEHEEQEVIGELASKEKMLREAREKLDLAADDKDLQTLLNPPKAKPKKEDDTSDSDSTYADDSGDDDDTGADDDDGLEDI